MTQHTPGPWVVEAPLGPEILSIVTQGRTFEWKHVAQINAEDCGLSVARANARLIAAAPDLLAALKDVTERYRCSIILGGTDPEFADIAVAQFQAVIAEAEGRS